MVTGTIGVIEEACGKYPVNTAHRLKRLHSPYTTLYVEN